MENGSAFRFLAGTVRFPKAATLRRGRSRAGGGEDGPCYLGRRQLRSPAAGQKLSTVYPAFFIAPAMSPRTIWRNQPMVCDAVLALLPDFFAVDPADQPDHRLLIPFIFADLALFPCLVAPHHRITGGAPRKAP